MKNIIPLLLILLCAKVSVSQEHIKSTLESAGYASDSFFLGASLNHFQLNTNLENLFLSEFNYLTPANAFKQTRIHPKPNVWKWDRAQNFIDFANKHNLTVRIHGPMSPQASKWAKNDERTPQELKDNMEEYFTALCKRANNESCVRWMDVVNETVLRDGTWFREKPGDDKWENPWTQIGINSDGFPKYIPRAFEIANEHAPNIKLVYNHNGGMEKAMWEKVMETVLYIKSKGLRVDAIGWQAHLRTNSLSEEDLKYLDYLIDWVHQHDLEFHVTELNLWVKEEITDLDSIHKIQNDLYTKIINKLISKKDNGVVALNFWGLKTRSGQSKQNKTIFSLFNEANEPNPVMKKVTECLKILSN